jgi:hypothetical protein
VNNLDFSFAELRFVGNLLISTLSLVCLPLNARAGAEEKVVPKGLTEQDLVVLRDQLSRERSTNAGNVVVPPAPPASVEPENLLARSTVLCFGGNLTLVPKKAVIHVPAGYTGRLSSSDGAQVLTWGDFFRLNRGWISTMEVTQAQAEGKELLNTVAVDKLTKSGNLIIATLHGNPITVLPQTTIKVPSEISDQSPPTK